MAVYKQGKSWYYVVDIGIDLITGKRKQERKGGFRKKTEAELAEGEIKRHVADGTFVRETDITFKEFVKEWLELYADNVKKSSVRVRKHESGCLIKFIGERTKLKDITPKVYQKALSQLKKDGYAENTLAGIHGTGRMIFKKAMEFRNIKIDPTKYAKVPRVQKTVEELEQETEIPKYLEKEQLALFLKTAHNMGLDNDYEIFTVLAYTGMRPGELCALKETDINTKEMEISITKTMYNPNGNIKKFSLNTPKTAKSKRIIEIDQIVIKVIEKVLAKQNKIKMRYRQTYHLPEKGFVFTSEKYPGYPTCNNRLESRMRRLLKLAKLDSKLTPHSLRHTHTSLLAEAGVSLEEIMDRLGHIDDKTTRKVYLHVTKTKKKEASKKFSELMKPLVF